MKRSKLIEKPKKEEKDSCAELENSLKKMPNKNRILNIHIPGTGTYDDTDFPTYLALENLKRCFTGSKKGYSPAIISLHGVGSENKEGYVPPVRRDTSTLNNRYMSKKQRFFKYLRSYLDGATAISSDDSEEYKNRLDLSNVVEPLASTSNNMACLFGRILGAGDVQNVEVVTNTLKKLKKAGCLPTNIVLSGHSRGAVNCIKLANHIFYEFPTIGLNIFLTDPVPGPCKDSYENLTIPPTVKTLSIFYAELEGCKYFKANHISKLRILSTNTIVTSYSLAKNHGDIGSSYTVEKAVTDLLLALHELGKWLTPTNENSDELCKDKRKRCEMKSENKSRMKHNYVCVTNIPKGVINDETKRAIERVRRMIDEDYAKLGCQKCFVYTRNPLPSILNVLKTCIKELKQIKTEDKKLLGKLSDILKLTNGLENDLQYLSNRGELKRGFEKRRDEFSSLRKQIDLEYKKRNSLQRLAVWKPNLNKKYINILNKMNIMLKLIDVQMMVKIEIRLRALVQEVGKVLANDSVAHKTRRHLNYQLSSLIAILNSYMENSYDIDNEVCLTKNLACKQNLFFKNLGNWYHGMSIDHHRRNIDAVDKLVKYVYKLSSKNIKRDNYTKRAEVVLRNNSLAISGM